jgi:hypothetical protein
VKALTAKECHASTFHMILRVPLALALLGSAILGIAPAAEPLDFNRHIRPILSENCFFCHGQDADKREADLRLDERESATQDLGGYAAIVPGVPEKSEMLLRLKTHEKDDVMPPPKSNRKVSPEQIALIERWIKEGAPYAKHWAFIPPAKPAVTIGPGGLHPIDALVRTRLSREGLAPAPAASAETWLRRASFDLTGLSPSPEEVSEFAKDVQARGEQVYAAAADRLLASPHFGERQAIEWLDVARYADTHGFNNDSARSMWRWRDWVIESFNNNLPYDRFITDQIAGDLLPNPTLDQRIATGFSRNHVINSEGGIIEEEYRVEYVADRVRTVSLAWVGLTMECARCHDHKYDPITQRDYYRLFAFFNNVPEHGEDGRIANAVPLIASPTREQSAELSRQQSELAALQQQMERVASTWVFSEHAGGEIARLVCQFHSQEPLPKLTLPGGAARRSSPSGRPLPADGTQAVASIEGKILDFGAKDGATIAMWIQPSADNAADVALLSNQDRSGSTADQGYGKGQELRLINGELEFRASLRFPAYALRVQSEGATIQPGQWRHVAVSFVGKTAAGVRMFVDGEEVATRVLYDGLHGGVSNSKYSLGWDSEAGGAKFRGLFDFVRVFDKVLPAADVRRNFLGDAYLVAMVKLHQAEAGDREYVWFRDVVLEVDHADFRKLREKYRAAWEAHLALRRTLPTTMVMQEQPQVRAAHVLMRGQYDAPGEAVEPGVPETLLGAWPEGAPRNRLGLAQWLTKPDHPMTARVVVNRFWAQLFGTGLVKSVEDFGFQGEWPSNPELLDWLAREFVDSGWNVKALLKQIVLSATYRQDSSVRPEMLARDPENRLLARGPRVRLPAELIRDHALSLAGLLKPRIGGPSVFPYQPETLYEGLVVGADYPGTKWVQSTGDDLYRRSLYTFWKRTVPHPAMLTFDAPDREFCVARRSRTNTPLQALALLNDPTYLEASRHLAARVWREADGSDEVRLSRAFQLATGRAPDDRERDVLMKSHGKLLAEFEKDPAGAAAFLKSGATPAASDLSPAELAAATAVSSMILNLDETLTKY